MHLSVVKLLYYFLERWYGHNYLLVTLFLPIADHLYKIYVILILTL